MMRALSSQPRAAVALAVFAGMAIAGVALSEARRRRRAAAARALAAARARSPDPGAPATAPQLRPPLSREASGSESHFFSSESASPPVSGETAPPCTVLPLDLGGRAPRRWAWLSEYLASYGSAALGAAAGALSACGVGSDGDGPSPGRKSSDTIAGGVRSPRLALSKGRGVMRLRARTMPLPPPIAYRRGGLVPSQIHSLEEERLAVQRAAPRAPRARSHEVYFGMDIGGSLAKIVHFEPTRKPRAELKRIAHFIRASAKYRTGVRDVHLQLGALEGTLHFIRFETRNMGPFLDIVHEEGLHAATDTLYATGGGAHKFAPAFEAKLGVTLEKLDELACCVRGVTWLLQEVPDELFLYQDVENAPRAEPYSDATGATLVATPYAIPAGGMYPFILVNIGSGVSILQIRGADDFARISGTAVGGGTFLGLCRLLGCADTFDEALENAARGDDALVNLLVEDIYGGGYDAFGLPPKLIASMFGKILRKDDPYEGVHKNDVCRALLVMISQVIAQVAFLSSERAGVQRVIFSGAFLHSNQIALRTLAYYVERWSDGAQHALFLKHEGYSGALGAFLFSAGIEGADEPDAAEAASLAEGEEGEAADASLGAPNGAGARPKRPPTGGLHRSRHVSADSVGSAASSASGRESPTAARHMPSNTSMATASSGGASGSGRSGRRRQPSSSAATERSSGDLSSMMLVDDEWR